MRKTLLLAAAVVAVGLAAHPAHAWFDMTGYTPPMGSNSTALTGLATPAATALRAQNLRLGMPIATVTGTAASLAQGGSADRALLPARH